MNNVDSDRIAASLESIAESLYKLANPPIVMCNDSLHENLKPGGVTYIADMDSYMKRMNVIKK